MNERRRMEYLQAMGITMYVPRWVLPEAKPPVAALLPVELTSQEDMLPAPNAHFAEASVTSAHQISRPHPKAADGLVTGIMDALAPPKRETPASPQVSTAPSAAAASQAASFALSIWRPSAALLVVDSRHARQALPTQNLLRNMLFAKGIADFGAKPDVLQWPPIAGVANPGDWTAAQEMVLAFVQARLERQPAQYVWLMGENAYRAVVGGEGFDERLGQAINLDQLGALAVVLPALTDMLLEPGLKAKAWAGIRNHHVR